MRALLVALALLAVLPAAARAGEPDATAPAYDVELRGSDGGFRWTGPRDDRRSRTRARRRSPASSSGSGATARAAAHGRAAVVISKPEGGVLGDPDAARLHRGAGRSSTRRSRRARAAASPSTSTSACRATGATASAAAARTSRCSPTRSRRSRTARAGAWRLDKWFGSGEAWTYPAAEWRVRLTAPDRVRIAAPGVLQPDGSPARARRPRLLVRRGPPALGAPPTSAASRSRPGRRGPRRCGSCARALGVTQRAAAAARSSCSARSAGPTSRSSSPTPRRWSTPR